MRSHAFIYSRISGFSVCHSQFSSNTQILLTRAKLAHAWSTDVCCCFSIPVFYIMLLSFHYYTFQAASCCASIRWWPFISTNPAKIWSALLTLPTSFRRRSPTRLVIWTKYSMHDELSSWIILFYLLKIRSKPRRRRNSACDRAAAFWRLAPAPASMWCYCRDPHHTMR